MEKYSIKKELELFCFTIRLNFFNYKTNIVEMGKYIYIYI